MSIQILLELRSYSDFSCLKMLMILSSERTRWKDQIRNIVKKTSKLMDFLNIVASYITLFVNPSMIFTFELAAKVLLYCPEHLNVPNMRKSIILGNKRRIIGERSATRKAIFLNPNILPESQLFEYSRVCSQKRT